MRDETRALTMPTDRYHAGRLRGPIAGGGIVILRLIYLGGLAASHHYVTVTPLKILTRQPLTVKTEVRQVLAAGARSSAAVKRLPQLQRSRQPAELLKSRLARQTVPLLTC